MNIVAGVRAVRLRHLLTRACREVLETLSYDKVPNKRGQYRRKLRAGETGVEEADLTGLRTSVVGGYKMAAKRAGGYLGQGRTMSTIEVPGSMCFGVVGWGA